MQLQALSVVAPWGRYIAEGRKRVEVRSWRPEATPIRNLLIVENDRHLTESGNTDPAGRAVAVVDIADVHPWRPDEAEAACSTWEPGWWAWTIEHVRPIATPLPALAARKLYRVDVDENVVSKHLDRSDGEPYASPATVTQNDADAVVLVTYDPNWPTMFMGMASSLRHRFGDTIERIEHVGSTAIPGMSAKPVVDMLVAIQTFDQAKQLIVPALVGEGWDYWWRDDRPPGHMMLIKRDARTGVRTHHVHMAPLEQAALWHRVAFRDYLIAHPAETRRYEQLKRELVMRLPEDREAYTTGKGQYVRAVTARAVQWAEATGRT